MGYYARGDYYRGDYYRGDLFGSLFQGIGKIGTAVAKVGGAIANPFGAIEKGFGALPQHFGGLKGGPPGPPGLSGGVPKVTGPVGPIPGGAMRGYHMNKSKLAPSKRNPKGAAPHTVLVRNRHMNVANPRALARASRRAHGFLKLASKFVRYYHPKKRAGRAYIGKRRRSR